MLGQPFRIMKFQPKFCFQRFRKPPSTSLNKNTLEILLNYFFETSIAVINT